MAKSLLTLLGNVADELGIPTPTFIFGNTDNQVKQLLALSNREGKEFAAMGTPWGGWPQMRGEQIISLVSVGSYTGNTTSGSTTISGLSSVSGVQVGYGVTMNGVPNASVVTSVGVNSVVINQPATVTATGTSVSFGKVAYDFPSDWQFFLSQTQWDRNFRWQLLGPLDAQEWQVLKSGISPTGPRRRFRIMGGKFYIDPVPSAQENGYTLVTEYITNTWCTSSGGTLQTEWAADTDTYLLDEDSFILGVKWRWKAAKGLPYAEERAAYEAQAMRAGSRAGGARALPLNASASGLRLLNNQNVPDSGFGS